MHRFGGVFVLVGSILSITLRAAPPAPPAIREERKLVPSEELARSIRPAAQTTPYSIGDPTDEEQLYLELVNRTRANPSAEGVRLANTTDPDILGAYGSFSVDLQKLQDDLAAIAPAQPLGFEPRLINAARGHSQWMLTNGNQSHNEVDPNNGTVLNTPGDRITAANYPWQRYAESIYAFASSVEFGYAGFEVDWGFGPGGVQDPPGHRENNHEPNYKEIGVGVIDGTGPNNTGPQVVTMDFGAQQNPSPLVTGVVYYDLNANGFYDLGEGLNGVTINVSDAAFYAVSTASGGYTVPAANGMRTVTFTAPGLSASPVNVNVVNGSNVKVDLVLPYVAPVVTGPAIAALNQPNSYAFTPVAGATGYRWRAASKLAVPTVFDAEAGLSRVTFIAPGTPTPLVPRAGGQAYHLTHGAGLGTEILELGATLRPRAGGAVQFLSKLGGAASDEVAQLEVSADDGMSWQVLWSQAGDGYPGETSYSSHSVNTGTYAGQLVRFRFAYVFAGGNYYNQTDEGFGLHLDNIQFTETDEIVFAAPVAVSTGSSFAFTPTVAQDYELSVQPMKARGTLPFGAPLPVTAKTVVVTTPTITGTTLGPNGKLRIDFTSPGALSPAPELLGATRLDGSFALVAATLKTNAPGNYSFQFDPAGAGTSQFLRVSVP